MINSDFKLSSKVNSQRLIIPIVLCNVTKINDVKLFNVKCSLNLSMNNMHIHVESFEESKMSWIELPLIMNNDMKLQLFPYNEYCSKPNHFQSKNEIICPVIPGNDILFLSAADYLRYIKKDIGNKVNISVIDVVEEIEIIWSFSELIKYFDKNKREKLYNQVSLEISSLPIKKEFKYRSLFKKLIGLAMKY